MQRLRGVNRRIPAARGLDREAERSMTAPVRGPFMGKEFTCPNCRHAHRFLKALAGQTMHCQGCGFVFRIPAVPLASPEGVEFTGTGKWLLQLASGRQFGPVGRETILEWLREGRAGRDSLVKRVDEDGWYRLGEIDSGAGTPAADPKAEALDVSPASILPAAGLLSLLSDDLKDLAPPRRRILRRRHAAAMKALREESSRTEGFVRLRESALVPMESCGKGRSRRGAGEPLMIDAVTIASFAAPHGGELYCVIPWSQLGRLPHEFLSILPGRLAAPVALRRKTEDAFDGGSWIGITGDDADVEAMAAARSEEALADGIQWNWKSRSRRFTMVQVWGVQAIPLGPEKFAHLVQTSIHRDTAARAGLRWYLERQSAFFRFARRLSLPGQPGSPVLFSSSAARILTMAADRLRESTVA